MMSLMVSNNQNDIIMIDQIDKNYVNIKLIVQFLYLDVLINN